MHANRYRHPPPYLCYHSLPLEYGPFAIDLHFTKHSFQVDRVIGHHEGSTMTQHLKAPCPQLLSSSIALVALPRPVQESWQIGHDLMCVAQEEKGLRSRRASTPGGCSCPQEVGQEEEQHHQKQNERYGLYQVHDRHWERGGGEEEGGLWSHEWNVGYSDHCRKRSAFTAPYIAAMEEEDA